MPQADALPRDGVNETTLVPDETAAVRESFGGEAANVCPDAEIETGAKLGKFVVKRLLGRGGMGLVYLAHDPAIDREVAIKVLSSGVCANAEAVERFRAEARASGRLTHPNVVSVHEIGEERGLLYLVMEYVPGGSVQDLIRGHKPIAPGRATEILADAAAGLAAAHAEKMIHRDIKPANLLLDEDGAVKVADFGLARRPDSGDARLTQSFRIVGTPHYMSPEQSGDANPDSRSDVYSLGATYHAMLTGHAPFDETSNAVDVIAAHMYEPRPDAHAMVSDVPAICTRIVQRAMAKAADQRYPTAEAMLADAVCLLTAMRDPAIAARDPDEPGGLNLVCLPSEQGGADSASLSGAALSDIALAAPRAATANSRKTFAGGSSASNIALAPAPVAAAAVPAMTGPPPGERREVFSLRHGECVVLCPRDVDAEELEDLRSWLDVVTRKICRDAEDGRGGGSHGDSDEPDITEDMTNV